MLEDNKMKKIYQAPQVNKVIYTSDIMEGQMSSQSIGVKGNVTGEGNEDGTWGFEGDGNYHIDSKRNGRFWDDEY